MEQSEFTNVSEGDNTVAAPPASEGQAPSSFMKDFVPKDYTEKPYMKQYLDDNKDVNAFFQDYDNMQSLIGRKGVILPSDNATEEEMNKFYSETGRPESADKYEFDRSMLPEDFQIDEEMDSAFKDILFKNGISAKAGKGLEKAYNEMMLAKIESINGQSQEEQAARDAEFDGLTEQLFGENKEKSLASAKAMLIENTPEFMKGSLADLDNKSLTVLAGILNNVKEKYGMEDNLNSNPESSGVVDKEAEKQSVMQELSTLQRRNALDPKIKVLQAKLNGLYGIK